MAIAITEVATDGHDLLNPQAQNRVAARWSGWALAAALVAALRGEGKTVLLRCVQALSRTPCVAALYGARLTGRTPTEPWSTSCMPCPRPTPTTACRQRRTGSDERRAHL